MSPHIWSTAEVAYLNGFNAAASDLARFGEFRPFLGRRLFYTEVNRLAWRQGYMSAIGVAYGL
jgi:hypothetical protein